MPANVPTLLAQMLVPDVWVPYMIERTAVKSKLFKSGIIVRDAEFDSLLAKGGKLIDMPFFVDLSGEDETVETDTEVSIGRITTSSDQSRRQMRQKGWGVEDLAKKLSGADPLAAIADLMADYWARRQQVLLLNTLTGIFAAASMAANSSDIYISSGTPLAANMLTAATFIDASQKLGDSKELLTAVAMHSSVEAHLKKLDLIEYFLDSEGKIELTRFLGHTVIVDDSITTEVVDSKTVYHTFLFGQGAFAYGEQTDFTPVAGGHGTWSAEVVRVGRAAQSQLINRRDFMLHPRGVKWNEAAVAGTFPTNAELATSSNWTRVFESKNIRIVRVRHNIA